MKLLILESWLTLITQDGVSALIKAAYYGKTDVVVELVKGGANLDLQNKVCIVMNTGYIPKKASHCHCST